MSYALIIKSLTSFTSQAFGRSMLKCLVVLRYTFRNAALCCCKIIELIYHSYINIYRTWFTMTAISTLPAVRMKRSICYYRSIIFLVIRCIFIIDSFIDLLFCVISTQDRRYSGTCKRTCILLLFLIFCKYSEQVQNTTYFSVNSAGTSTRGDHAEKMEG